MAVHKAVLYIPCTTYLRRQTGDIITFAQFEEWGLLSKTFDDAERGDKSDDNSIFLPLISEEEIDVIDSGNESDDEPMSTEMLEDIIDGSKSHTSVNRREAHYKIHHRVKQRQKKFKGALLSMQNMGKGLHKVFKAVVNQIS